MLFCYVKIYVFELTTTNLNLNSCLLIHDINDNVSTKRTWEYFAWYEGCATVFEFKAPKN